MALTNKQEGTEPKLQHENQHNNTVIADIMSEKNKPNAAKTTENIVEPQYPPQNRKALVPFRTNRLAHSRDDDEQTAKVATNGEEC